APGPYFFWAMAPGAAQARVNATRKNCHERLAIAPPPRFADQAGYAARQEIHEHDEHDAVDRPRRRLGDLVGDVGDELYEYCAENGPFDGGEPADHDSHEERDGEEGGETVGRHELDGDGAKRAAHARVHRAHAERERLVERDVDAHGARRER